MFKDEDLKIGPRGSSRTRTFLEDNTLVSNKRRGFLDIQSCQRASQPYASYVIPQHLPQHKVLTQIAYSVLENFRGLELPRTRTRTRTRTWKLVLEDPRGQGLSSRTTTPSKIQRTCLPWRLIQVATAAGDDALAVWCGVVANGDVTSHDDVTFFCWSCSNADFSSSISESYIDNDKLYSHILGLASPLTSH